MTRLDRDTDHAIKMCHYHYQHELSASTYLLKPTDLFLPLSLPRDEIVSEVLRRYSEYAPYRTEVENSFNETVTVNPNKWRNRHAA